ncbi:MAG: response regulator [Planctomycetota bacterium]|jgi:DNA-binding NtrC family response regulator
MDSQDSDPKSGVWLVTRHEEFAAAASRQLAVYDQTVRIVPPEHARGALRTAGASAAVALVDCDAKTPDGSALYESIRASLPHCRIVLVGTPDQASAAARLVRSACLWDYLLTDCVRDANRVPIVVERAQSGGQRDSRNAEPHQPILDTLKELRDALGALQAGEQCEVEGGRWPDDPARLTELVCRRLDCLEEEIRPLEGESSQPVRSPNKNRILVVDDSDICSELAKGILERSGFEVIVADTAWEAKYVLNEGPPALVLMDIHLGDANGIELGKMMRSGTTCPSVPVIVITGDRMRDTLLDAMGVNIQGYLLKPYEPSVLVGKIREVLHKSEQDEEDPGPPANPEGASSSQPEGQAVESTERAATSG